MLGLKQELHVPAAFKHGLSSMFDLVGLERLELSTSRLSGVRSNHLSYRPARLVFVLPAASRSPCPAVMYFFVHSLGQGSPSLPEQKIPARAAPNWWSWTGLNRRPPACKADALPAELQPQGAASQTIKHFAFQRTWSLIESEQRVGSFP